MTYKIAFVHIPKTAGGSVVLWSKYNQKQNEFRSVGHRSLREYLNKRPNFDYKTSFAIVRNTYDRMISLYNFKRNKILKDINKAEKKNLQEVKKERLNLLEVWEKGIIYFIDFCVEHQSRSTLSQLHFIENVDTIIHFENLKNEFSLIQNELQCYSPLVQQKHSKPKESSVEISDDYINCIKRHFKEEIEYFDYNSPRRK